MRDAEGKRRGKADRPGDLGHRLGDHLLRRLEIGEDRGGALIIGLADVGRLGAARGAGEQARAEPLLEPGDPAREDRLGKAHPFGGAGEGAGLDHPHEGEDVDQVGGRTGHACASPWVLSVMEANSLSARRAAGAYWRDRGRPSGIARPPPLRKRGMP